MNKNRNYAAHLAIFFKWFQTFLELMELNLILDLNP